MSKISTWPYLGMWGLREGEYEQFLYKITRLFPHSFPLNMIILFIFLKVPKTKYYEIIPKYAHVLLLLLLNSNIFQQFFWNSWNNYQKSSRFLSTCFKKFLKISLQLDNCFNFFLKFFLHFLEVLFNFS